MKFPRTFYYNFKYGLNNMTFVKLKLYRNCAFVYVWQMAEILHHRKPHCQGGLFCCHK